MVLRGYERGCLESVREGERVTCQFNVSTSRDEDVVWLNIPVYHPMGVEIRQSHDLDRGGWIKGCFEWVH